MGDVPTFLMRRWMAPRSPHRGTSLGGQNPPGPPTCPPPPPATSPTPSWLENPSPSSGQATRLSSEATAQDRSQARTQVAPLGLKARAASSWSRVTMGRGAVGQHTTRGHRAERASDPLKKWPHFLPMSNRAAGPSPASGPQCPHLYGRYWRCLGSPSRGACW